MPLAVRTLRDSSFAASSHPEAFRCAVLLWCAAWHQVPAGSLPDNDKELAQLSGMGRDLAAWATHRAEALWKFAKHDDGRLYHPEIVAAAQDAWKQSLRHHYDRACDRLRKANKQRQDAGQAPMGTLTFEQWDAARMSAGIPPERVEAAAAVPAPPRPAKAAAPAAAPTPPPPAPPVAPGPVGPPVDVIFAVGIPLLQQAGVADRNARSFLGHLRKQAAKGGGDEAVVDALQRCVLANAVDPVTFLQGCFKSKASAGVAPWRAERHSRIAEMTGGKA
jgi:hypothetical protein